MQKKIILLLPILLCCSMWGMHAEQRVVGQFSFNDAYTLNEAMCILEDSNVWYSITMTNPKSDFMNWSAAGDIQIKNGNTSTVQVHSVGSAKGRIYYNYNQGDCGSQALALDVYKRFDPNIYPYSLSIEGPDCITEGDTVVYSIKPILTENINAGIGMDSYIWNITDTGFLKPPFVDTVIYKSGDVSSVTFRVGQIIGEESISLQVGIANESNPIVKTLGKTAPKAHVNSIVCVSYSDTRVPLQVNNPIDGVTYSWSCSNDEWGFENIIGPSTVLNPGGTDAPIIYVTAYYADGAECSSNRSQIQVVRSWASTVSVKSDGVNFPCKMDSSYTFSVSEGTTGGGLLWTCPVGWSMVFNSGKSVKIKPTDSKSIRLVDTLKVAANHSCAAPGTDETYTLLYVKPAKVRTISGQECLTAGQTYTFKATEWGNGPIATKYDWYIDGQIQHNYDGDSISFTATTGMQTISVRPRGAYNAKDNVTYYGDTTLRAINFSPTPPTGIIAAHCITTGMPDTVTLRLTGITPNQGYRWVLPNGVDSVLAGLHDTTICIETNGLPGNYTIWAYGKGSGLCGKSDSISYTFNIGTVDFDIAISPFLSGFLVQCNPLSQNVVSTYTWYVDGNHYAQAEGQYFALIYNQFQQVQIIVTLSDGCKQSITQQNEYYVNNAPKSRQNLSIEPVDKIQLIPNPAQNEVSIVFPKSNSTTDVSILDVNGHILKSMTTQDERINISIADLSDGTYPIIVNQNGNLSAEVLIIKH